MTWEEHLIYLTPNAFKHLLRHYGFTLILYHLYPYPHESSLVVLVRKNISNDNSNNPLELDKEIRLGDNYANNFFKLKNLVCDFISKKRNRFFFTNIFQNDFLHEKSYKKNRTTISMQNNISDRLSMVSERSEQSNGIGRG